MIFFFHVFLSRFIEEFILDFYRDFSLDCFRGSGTSSLISGQTLLWFSFAEANFEILIEISLFIISRVFCKDFPAVPLGLCKGFLQSLQRFFPGVFSDSPTILPDASSVIPSGTLPGIIPSGIPSETPSLIPLGFPLGISFRIILRIVAVVATRIFPGFFLGFLV